MNSKVRKLASIKFFLLVLSVIAFSFIAIAVKPTQAVPSKADIVTNKVFKPEKDHAQTTRAIVNTLIRHHYLDERLNDSFSEEVYENYLDMLDPGKAHFLSADIKEFSKLKKEFDDNLVRGNLKPAFAIYNRYHQRRLQRINYVLELLDNNLASLDFNKTEYLELEREDLPWHKDLETAEDLWRRLLKNEALNLRLSETTEEEILTSLKKRYRNQLRILKQTNDDDVFEFFITAYTHSYDPHTDYFPPDESENFDIHMRLSLEGIGALLQREDEYVKVVKLITGGPAERGKELQPADRIISVGQGKNGELQDVEGWRLDDVVDLIRGPKGTVVRLKVIPADSTDIATTKTIAITRDTVKLEEQSAKKKTIEIMRGETKYRVGIIELPIFYLDYEAAMAGDPNYRSSTRDVEKLILELLDDNIDGLIVDLRNNGGGSLKEANDMTGLFIRTGPIVQIRDANNRVELHSDLNPKLVYTGPLAVLVNRLSASASEILAGAIQDHGRGIVIGSQTFGKGTVQSMNPLKPGRIKFTQSKYYRISGDSTQERGVIPDIVFPTVIDKDEIGESSLPQAMAWDQIKPVRYRKLANLSPTIDYLINRHNQRIHENPDFNYLNERVRFLENNRNKTRVSLMESERRQEREETKSYYLAMENKRRLARDLKPYKTYKELEESEEAGEETDEKEKESDSLLQETGDILIDWLILAQKKLALH